MVNPSTVIENKHLKAKARVGCFKVVIVKIQNSAHLAGGDEFVLDTRTHIPGGLL